MSIFLNAQVDTNLGDACVTKNNQIKSYSGSLSMQFCKGFAINVSCNPIQANQSLVFTSVAARDFSHLVIFLLIHYFRKL